MKKALLITTLIAMPLTAIAESYTVDPAHTVTYLPLSGMALTEAK